MRPPRWQQKWLQQKTKAKRRHGALVDPRAIKKYLGRDLTSFDWLKKCTPKEIDEAIQELDPVPIFNYKEPYFRQKVGFLLFEYLQQFFLMYDMGGGKTKVVLDVLAYRKQCGLAPRAIVFVPYVTAVRTWVKECALWRPELACVPLLGTREQNLQLLQESTADLFVTTYQGAASFLSKKVTVKKKGKVINKWDINSTRIQRLFREFTMMALDESDRMGGIHSIYYRIVLAISKVVEDRCALSGTPFGTDPTELWGQFRVIDNGETFGTTIGMFKASLFEEVETWGGHTTLKFDPKNKRIIHKMMKNRSLRYLDTEGQDLPKKVEIEKNIEFPKELHSYHKAATEEFKALLSKEARKKNFAALKSGYTRLQQLSSGFMTFKGEGNDRIKIRFKTNPKLDTLIEIVKTMPKRRKLVVFHNFIQTNHIISDGLKKEKIKHARIWGEQKNPFKELDRFEDDPKCKVLVLNSKSGSTSLNLQHANFLVFFELPPLKDFKQAIKRVYRDGQKRRVYVYFLLMEGTYDDSQYRSLLKGEEFFVSIIDGKIKV